MSTSDQGEPTLSTAAVAARLRVSPATVRRWIMGGALPATQVPARGKRHDGWRIAQRTLDAILQPPTN